MTSGFAQHGQEPGESDFSWGRGMSPPEIRGYELTNFDQLKMAQSTDPSNPGADEARTRVANPTESHIDESTGLWVGGDMREGQTPRVREQGPSSTSGQHAIIDPTKYTKGHYADGHQDGSGDAWRASLPPNPVL